MKRYTAIIVLLVLAALAVAALFFFDKNAPLGATAPLATLSGTSSPAGAVQSIGSQQLLANGLAMYSSQPYHFSLEYSSTLSGEGHREQAGGPLAVLIANKDGSQLARVFAVPYGEASVSRARFLTDLPSGVMQNTAAVTVDGVSGTMFNSTDSQLGATIEIWFIHNGILYEVDTYASQAAWLQQIMQSWKFI